MQQQQAEYILKIKVAVLLAQEYKLLEDSTDNVPPKFFFFTMGCFTYMPHQIRGTKQILLYQVIIGTLDHVINTSLG